MDSGASNNVMSRRHLKGYKVQPSAGSRRGQRWGCASGKAIENEGEVHYRFMNEDGKINRGVTQVGEARRPLAAVSSVTHNDKMVFFCSGDDWIIDRRDELADQILQLVRRATKKTKMHEHRGTYRVRAWMMPPKKDDDKGSSSSRPFGRQGA